MKRHFDYNPICEETKNLPLPLKSKAVKNPSEIQMQYSEVFKVQSWFSDTFGLRKNLY